jgi:hypothetical protein
MNSDVIRFVDMTEISVDLFEPRSGDRPKACGEFRVDCWKGGSYGYLFELDDFDEEIIEDVELKRNQKVFRYEVKVMFGLYRPLIAIDLSLKSPRAYFLTEEAHQGDDIEFYKAGEKITFINLDHGMSNKF